jgi:hypothetical protein
LDVKEVLKVAGLLVRQSLVTLESQEQRHHSTEIDIHYNRVVARE